MQAKDLHRIPDVQHDAIRASGTRQVGQGDPHPSALKENPRPDGPPRACSPLATSHVSSCRQFKGRTFALFGRIRARRSGVTVEKLHGMLKEWGSALSREGRIGDEFFRISSRKGSRVRLRSLMYYEVTFIAKSRRQAVLAIIFCPGDHLCPCSKRFRLRAHNRARTSRSRQTSDFVWIGRSWTVEKPASSELYGLPIAPRKSSRARLRQPEVRRGHGRDAVPLLNLDSAPFSCRVGDFDRSTTTRPTPSLRGQTGP